MIADGISNSITAPRFSRLRRLVGLALASASACTCAASGTIKGTVTSTTGQPVTAGSILITVNGVIEPSASIDNTGTYSTVVTWPGTNSATCHLQSDVSGYINESTDLSLQPDGSVDGVFVLTPDFIMVLARAPERSASAAQKKPGRAARFFIEAKLVDQKRVRLPPPSSAPR